MTFAFRKKKNSIELERVSQNLMYSAIDPDKCWEIASLIRDTGMPGNVRTCEICFLMGSVVRDIIRATARDEHQDQCISAAEAEYFKEFDEQSNEPLPPEMVEVYGDTTLGRLCREALTSYGEHNDILFLTSGLLINRLKGDPRMKFEITPLIEERASPLRAVFSKAIK